MKNNKGFSLVEILAVVVILGILFTIGVTAYTRYIQKARRDAYNTMIISAENAMENYMMDHPGVTRATFEDLYEGDYLDKPIDPSDRSADCKGRIIAEIDPSSKDAKLNKYKYTTHLCCANHIYSYNADGEVEDRYCKADVFNQETIDKIKERKIKVLNVYPNSGVRVNLQNWMNSYGSLQGVQVIQVTPVFIDTFNADPAAYVGTAGNWKYDIIVFGFYDCYGSKDLSVAAASKVREFTNDGGPIIFGHDTITTGCGNHKNFISLQDTVGLTASGDLNWNPSSKVVIKREGVFTEYPHKIGHKNTILSIPTTHVYGQVANGATVWLSFENILDENKSIYLSTYGNNSFIQTGHSGGTATTQEQQIIANIIFYMIAQQYGAE